MEARDLVTRILVVDDDPMMLELYREILTRVGREVLIAENGTQGLARSDRKPVSGRRPDRAG